MVDFILKHVIRATAFALLLSAGIGCKSWGKFWSDATNPVPYSGSAITFESGSNLHARSGIFGGTYIENYAGEIWTGVIYGTLPPGATGVEVAWDDSTTYAAASLLGSSWRVFTPTGASAAAGYKLWQIGTRHTMSVRAIDSAGTRSNPVTITFVRQINKDVNGDGYADIVISGHQNSGTASAAPQSAGAGAKGSLYVYYGSANGIARRDENSTPYYCGGPPDCTVVQNPDNTTSGFFGNSKFAGDVNGDGYADIVAGSPINNGGAAAGGQTAGQTAKGAGYVFYGSANGITLHPESPMPYFCSGTPDCTVVANPDDVSSGNFATTVGTAGDINGDGYADVIFGAPGNSGSGAAGGQSFGTASKGAAYVFYGSANGITLHGESATPYYCSGPPDCTVIANPDNATGNFGSTVGYAGLINGDNYADLVIGAPLNSGVSAAGGQSAGAASKGSVYVFYGKAAGVTRHDENATPYYCSGPPDCTVAQNPDNSGGNFGTNVSAAGDINADGFADILVGAPLNNGASAAGGQSAGSPTKGAAYVIYGAANGITRHDENATPYYCSGFPDCTVIQNPDNITAGNFGNNLSNAGDINFDGYSDILIGAKGNSGANAAGGQSAGAANKGAAYVYFGSASGVVRHDENATPYYCSAASDCIVIGNPDNFAGNFGIGTGLAGDVNNDGYPDILIGAYANDGSGAAGGQSFGVASKGAAYIFYGSSAGVTKHDESATPYYCSGFPDCTVIQNPDNAAGNFGFRLSYFQLPTFRWSIFARPSHI